jgi:hypothetical protein
MPHFMWKFWNVCMNVCDVYDLNCGQKITGSCITTMHPCTQRLLCVSFSPKRHHYHGSPLPIHPDLAPCDFFLFPKVKTSMWGEHFGDVENVNNETTRLLKNLTSQDMQHCFLQWKKHWAKCIHLGESTLRVTMCPFQNNWNRFLVSSVHEHFVHTTYLLHCQYQFHVSQFTVLAKRY